jgi:hypothetical protein
LWDFDVGCETENFSPPSAGLIGTDLQRKSAWRRLFRLDTSKFRSGILNSYGGIPIAPQACACNQKTGEIGSQS